MTRNPRTLHSRYRHGCGGCGARDNDRCTCDDDQLECAGAQWAWNNYLDDYGESDVVCFNCHRAIDEHTANLSCLWSPTRWVPAWESWSRIEVDGGMRYECDYERLDCAEARAKFVTMQELLLKKG